MSTTNGAYNGAIVVGIKDPFRSDEHCHQVIKYGLPSQFHPSDHLSIGCILEWDFKDNPAADLSNNQQELLSCTSKITVSDEKKEMKDENNMIWQEIDNLMKSCQFISDKQKLDFQFVISPIDLVKGRKPTQEQIDAIRKRREVKKKIFSEVSEEVKSVMEKIVVLSKKKPTSIQG